MEKSEWNIKPILFFLVLFGIIVYGYFQYDTFTKYIPIPNFIKIFILIIGLAAIFFPHFMNKVKESDTMEEIKEFLVEKYGKK